MKWLALLLALSGCRLLPLGEINHHYLETEPSVSDPKIGSSHAFPTALRILVSHNSSGALSYIGQTAHDALFADYPDFAFKVEFASANTNLCAESDYANPKSIWSNVFFGYYEIDVPTRSWKRPFGYVSASTDSPIAFEDIVRVGKADWNYFSNHMYGVPKRYITPLDAIDMNAVTARDLGRKKLGRDWWDHITMSHVPVVSAARARSDHVTLTDTDSVYTDAWRAAFGEAPPSDSISQSFPPVHMGAELYMSFRKQFDAEYGEEVYKTLIFGGTINEDFPDANENARFLALQLDSLVKIIPSERRTGFPHDRPAPGVNP